MRFEGRLAVEASGASWAFWRELRTFRLGEKGGRNRHPRGKRTKMHGGTGEVPLRDSLSVACSPNL